MSKASKVRGLDPGASLYSAVEPVLLARIGDVWDRAECVGNAADVSGLHNMRIAAKRLRYCMEFLAPCLGDRGEEATLLFKQLQDYLGEIHDCDTWAVLLANHIDQSQSVKTAALAEANTGDSSMLDAATKLAGQASDAELEAMLAVLADVLARRNSMHAEFLAFWDEMEGRGLRGELEELARASGAA